MTYTKKIKQNIISQLRSKTDTSIFELDIKDGLYIYGAGELGGLAADYCESCDIPVLGVIDKNKIGYLTTRRGSRITITHLSEANTNFNKLFPIAVAVATQPFSPIKEELVASGWQKIVPFYTLTRKKNKVHPLNNGWIIDEVSNRELISVKQVCSGWADERSLIHYEAFISWHKSNTESILDGHPITPRDRYAIPEIQNHIKLYNKHFVDIGAHQGNAVKRLASHNFIFDRYTLVEPDTISAKFLSENKGTIFPKNSKFTILDRALGEENHLSNFQDGLGYCSQIWDNGTKKVDVITLDSLELNPSYLKVHTEGTEASILKGGISTIKKHKPLIAYSVYHRREGFYEDIAEIMKLFEGYNWFFRLHSFHGTGAFVYAIPTEG